VVAKATESKISIGGDRQAHQAAAGARGQQPAGPRRNPGTCIEGPAQHRAASQRPGSRQPPGWSPDRSISTAAFESGGWVSPRWAETGLARGGRPAADSPAGSLPQTNREQQAKRQGGERTAPGPSPRARIGVGRSRPLMFVETARRYMSDPDHHREWTAPTAPAGPVTAPQPDAAQGPPRPSEDRAGQPSGKNVPGRTPNLPTAPWKYGIPPGPDAPLNSPAIPTGNALKQTPLGSAQLCALGSY